MIKVFVLVFSSMICTGGCHVGNGVSLGAPNVKNMPAISEQKTVEDKIFKHAEANFSLTKAEADLKKITSLDLPGGVEAYYLEKRGTHGGQFYNYFAYRDNLYCSHSDGDFERYLKDLQFPAQKTLSAEQFWNSFQQLKFKEKEALPVNEKLLANPYEFVKPFLSKISKPALKYEGSGAVFTFYTVNTDDEFVSQNTVDIAADSRVTVKSERLK